MIIDRSEVKKAAALLKRGGVIGYPTETVYGLGGHAINAGVVSRIQRMKGREDNKPMLILIPDNTFILSVADSISEQAFVLMEQFWPGPLTLVFKAIDGLPTGLTGKDGGIGLRISSDPVCQELLTYFRAPIISTSANFFNHPPARSAEEVESYFKDHLDAILDGGERNLNAPSSVIDVRSRPAKLIRQGAIELSLIQSYIGEIVAPENV